MSVEEEDNKGNGKKRRVDKVEVGKKSVGLVRVASMRIGKG